MKHFMTYVNRRCHMRCPYCYDQRERTGAEMSAATVEACLKFFRAQTRPGELASVMFLGGEPSLSPGVLRHFLSSVPENWRFEMMTNAHDWPDEFLSVIEPFKSRMTVVASHDGRFQDRRLPGSGARVRANIRRLLAAGFDVLPCWTLDRDSVAALYENARDLLRLHRKLFVKRNCCHNIWGSDPQYLKGLSDNLDRFVTLMAWNRIERGGYVQTLNRIELGSRLECLHRPGTFSCHSGLAACVVIDLDGSLYPCELYVAQGRHRLGDVFRGYNQGALESLRDAAYPGAEVWHNVCPYWNEVRNKDALDLAGCLNDAADRMLFAARFKFQGLLDRLDRLKRAQAGREQA